MHSSGRKHALRKTLKPSKPYLLRLCSLSKQKAYIHGSLIVVLLTDRFDAFFNPNDASRDERYKQHSVNVKKKYEYARHRCCLRLNFGDNANYFSHSDRRQPLTDREKWATLRSFTSRMTKIQTQLYQQKPWNIFETCPCSKLICATHPWRFHTNVMDFFLGRG